MGRQLKRVPIDFDWPIDKTWEGYLNPHYKPCPSPDCVDGYTPARKWLDALVHLLLIAGADSLKLPLSPHSFHPYLRHLENRPEKRFTPDLAELTIGLAGRAPTGLFGHDSIDGWHAVDKIITAAGLDPKVWGICPTCKGSCVDPEAEEAYEAWKPTEPPAGEGYQLWENTTEGSPQSPVFETLDALCVWCERNETTFGPHTATTAKWKQMLSEDFVYHQEGNAIFL